MLALPKFTAVCAELRVTFCARTGVEIVPRSKMAQIPDATACHRCRACVGKDRNRFLEQTSEANPEDEVFIQISPLPFLGLRLP